MKKAFTIPSILLASLISFSVSANANPMLKNHPHSLEVIQAKQHPSMINSVLHGKIRSNHEDWFEIRLAVLQNNDTHYLDLDENWTIDQELQLLAALKNNTSVRVLFLGDQNMFDPKNKEAYAPVVAALVDVLNTHPTINVIYLDGHWAEENEAPECVRGNETNVSKR
jgi:hypothetical protein